jgi:hypothetical protein
MPQQLQQANVVHAAQYRGFVAIVHEVQPEPKAAPWHHVNRFTALAKTMDSVEMDDDFQFAWGNLTVGFYPTWRDAMDAIQTRIDEHIQDT